MSDNSLRTAAIQFLKFNAVGLLNTAVDFVVFTLLSAAGAGYAIAQVISYSAGTANSFILNKKVTFRDRQKAEQPSFDRMQLVKFILLNLVSLGVSLVLMHVLADRLGMQVLLSKVLVTGVTVVINFVGSRKWVF